MLPYEVRRVQIIVNCFAPYGEGFVMLQKPRRGWWVLPGGKVDCDETWPEAAKREMLEEAGLTVDGLSLRGVYLLHIESSEAGDEPTRRLLAQFSAKRAHGTLLTESKEGIISVMTAEQLQGLPMDEGDRKMVQTTLNSVFADDSTVYFGKFHYDAEHQLLDWNIELQVP